MALKEKPKTKGRPTKYKPEYVKLARHYTELGATLEQLARFFEVDLASVNRWIEAHSEFRNAIKETRELADSKVEQSLYKRACGLSKVVERITKDGEIVSLREEVPPDTAAAFIWLKNRKPKEWRDKQSIELSGNVEVKPFQVTIGPIPIPQTQLTHSPQLKLGDSR